MNIVFMGTPDFAAVALKALVGDAGERFSVKTVVTRPDGASSRGKTLLPSPVRVAADAQGIPVITPRSFYVASTPSSDRATGQKRVVDTALLDTLAAADPDFIVVAAFGLLLPPEVLALPRYGCINIHGSLLPRWRGAAPIQRAILAGDERVGVCIMRMEEGLDTGPYCAFAETVSADKNTSDLTQELAALGAQLLLEMLPRIADGSAVWVEQPDAGVTYAEKIAKNELLLDPAESAGQNILKVRASTEQAPARCVIAGRTVTVLAARRFDEGGAGAVAEEAADAASGVATGVAGAVGTVTFVAKRLVLRTSDGAFEVTSLKPDGKNAMDAKSFAAGIKELQKGASGVASWQSMAVEAGS